MALINPLLGSNLASTGFDSTLIGNSIWLEGAGTSGDAMTRLWGAQSNQDRWIWATWFQPLRLADATATRSVIFASGAASHGFYLRHNSTASTFNIFHRDNAGSEGAINTTESYRDLTAWIHVLVDYDSANANAEDRISLYVNGIRTGVNSGNRPGQNNDLQVNVQNQTARIGQDVSTTPNYHMKGYLAQTIFLDNKSIANSDLAITDFLDTFTFGTNGSQIVPKADADIIALASAAGNNSFCLDYSNSSSGTTLVADASSKGNNLTTSTIASANQSLHSPSKVYATWNALDSALNGHNTDMTLSDGGTVTEDGNGAFCRSTFSIPEGLFSYQVTVDDSTSNQMFGVALDTATDRANGNTNHPNMYAVNTSNGGRNTNGSGSSAVSGYSWSDGDTMEVYVSRSGTTYKIWYGKNGTLLNNASGSQGDPSAGTNELFSFTHTGDVFFSVDYTNAGTKKATTDFGQRGYTPAENALTLSTPNIPAPTHFGIDHFNAVTYTGNGTAIASGGKAVTGVGFKPDFVWIKNRDASDSHALYDVVRGTTKQVETDTTAIETTEAEGLSTFNSDGFTVGSLAELNTNTEGYISWNWKAGGSASSNSNGSITSSVSAAAPGHFSIVSWTGNTTAGATVGHGLGGAPEFIIAIARNEAGENKPVYHKFMTADTDHLKINENNAQGTAGTTIWDESAMSSTVIGLGAAAQSNSTNGMVAYCFRSVPGVCKFGKFTSANAQDGNYISLGFKPRWILIRRADSTGRDWQILDTSRSPINVAKLFLEPNTSDAEATSTDTANFHADLLSDGFKIRTNSSVVGGNPMIFLAMAEIGGNGTLPPIYGR